MREKIQVIKDRASKYTKKGQNKRAIKEYEKLLNRKPGDARILHRLAELWARQNAAVKAVDLFLQAATEYARAGFTDRAMSVLKQALSVDSTRLDANLRLAEQYVEKGFERDAVVHLVKAAAAYDKAGKEKQQLQVLQRAVDLVPGDVDGHMHLARLYAKTGRQDEARGKFLHAARELKKADRLDEFVTVADKAIETGETDPDLYHSLAECHIRRKNFQGALDVLDRQIHIRSDDLRSLQLTAEAHLGMEQPSKAAPVFKRLARLARRNKDDALAQAAVDKLKEIAPGSVTGEFPALPPFEEPKPEEPPPSVESLDDEAVLEDLEDLEDEDTSPGADKIEPPDLTEDYGSWDEDTETVSHQSLKTDENTLMVAIDDILNQLGDAIYPGGPDDSEEDAELSESIKEADFYIGQGLLDEAEDVLNKLAESNPRHPDIMDRLGEILRMRGIEFEDTERLK